MSLVSLLSIAAIIATCVLAAPPQPNKAQPMFIPVLYDVDVYPEIARMDSLTFTDYMLRKMIPSYDALVGANPRRHDSVIVAIPEGAIQYIPMEVKNRVPSYKFVFLNVDENGHEYEVYYYTAPFKPPSSLFKGVVPTPASDEVGKRSVNDESFLAASPLSYFDEFQSLLPSAVGERDVHRGDSVDPIYVLVLYSSLLYPEIAQLDSLQFTKYMMDSNNASADSGSVQYVPIDSDDIVELVKCAHYYAPRSPSPNKARSVSVHEQTNDTPEGVSPKLKTDGARCLSADSPEFRPSAARLPLNAARMRPEQHLTQMPHNKGTPLLMNQFLQQQPTLSYAQPAFHHSRHFPNGPNPMQMPHQMLHEQMIHQQMIHEQMIHEQMIHEQMIHEQMIHEQMIHEQMMAMDWSRGYPHA